MAQIINGGTIMGKLCGVGIAHTGKMRTCGIKIHHGCRVCLLPFRDVEIAVEHPRIHWLFLGLNVAFGRRSAVCVVVEIVVNLNVITAQLHIVGKLIVESNHATAFKLLTINGTSLLAIGSDFGQRHILRFIGTAARTECAQQKR